MITPNDIETKVFSSSLRGYNKKEVDEFLDQVMIDYQALMDQNAKMLERVHVLQKQVAEAKDPAKMTQDAKRLMNDISASAEQKAEVIIRNAKHDAENIVRNAKNSTTQADEDAERLRRKVEKFKLRFKQLLEEEIERVDDNSEDLLDDLRKDFYPTLLYGEKEPDATLVAGGAAAAEDPIADLPDVEPTGDLDQNPDAEVQGEPEAAAQEEAEEVPAEAEEQEPAEETEAEIEEAPEAEDKEAAEVTEDTVVIPAAEPEEPAEEEEADVEIEEIPGEEPDDVKVAEKAGAAEETEEAAPADEENLNMAQGGVPAETIVIDRAALDKALKEQDGADDVEESFEAEFEEALSMDPDEPGEGVRATDKTVILEKPEEITEAAAKYGEYDDPDRTEVVPEPESETEEEQASKYADYAAKFMNVFKKDE